jgi:hypothetical protein
LAFAVQDDYDLQMKEHWLRHCVSDRMNLKKSNTRQCFFIVPYRHIEDCEMKKSVAGYMKWLDRMSKSTVYDEWSICVSGSLASPRACHL